MKTVVVMKCGKREIIGDVLKSIIWYLLDSYLPTVNVKIKYFSLPFFPFVIVNVRKCELASFLARKSFELAKGLNHALLNKMSIQPIAHYSLIIQSNVIHITI